MENTKHGREVTSSLQGYPSQMGTASEVYLSGAIHDTDDQGQGWRDALKAVVGGSIQNRDVSFLSPLDKGPDIDDSEETSCHQRTKVVQSDMTLLDRSDGVLVRYDGEKTFGTMMEIALAQKEFNIPVSVAWKSEMDVPIFVRYVASSVRPNVPEALMDLCGNGVSSDVTKQISKAYQDEIASEGMSLDLEEQTPGLTDEEVDELIQAEEITKEISEFREEFMHEFFGDDSVEEADEEAVEAVSGSVPESGDKTARMILERVGGLVDGDRDTHGDAVQNQEHIAEGWNWYLGGKFGIDAELDGGDVARMMQMLKTSRQCVGEYDFDHDIDSAGYDAIAAAVEAQNGEAEAFTEFVNDD